MTNPRAPDSDLPTGDSGNSPRPFSYSATPSPSLPVSTFLNHPSRTSVFSEIILQHFPGMSPDVFEGLERIQPRAPTRPSDMEGHRYPSHSNGASSRPGPGFAPRPPQLGSFSRAFEMFTAGAHLDGAHVQPDGFFIPSYLKDTAYADTLRDAHRAKLKARGEGKTQEPQATPAPAVSNGSGGSGGASGQFKRLSGGEQTSYAVYEKPKSQPDPSPVDPLPSKWNTNDKWPVGIEVLANGMEVKYTSHKQGSEQETASIRANHPIPPECGIYYFEVTIVSSRKEETTIGVGMCTKNAALSRPPGWEPESWGYHGDDGNSFNATISGKRYGPKYTLDDVVGCGVNFNEGYVFFTKNGHNLGPAYEGVKGNLYPCIGLKKYGEHIRANFGQTPFVFDIDGMMRKEKQRVHDEINNTDISSLELRLQGQAITMSETDLIQSLVLQLLQHDGYVETARAFTDELQSERQALAIGNGAVAPIDVKDDQDATNRQRIRRAILEGDIDRAFELIESCYPNVLNKHPPVYLRLKCRRFIEMVRSAAEIRLQHEGKRANGIDTSQAMELDTNGVEPHHAWDKMDTEDGGDEPDELRQLDKLERDMLEYGQQLASEYHNNPDKDIAKELEEIWALMAYPNPFKEPKVSHLVSNQARMTAAEMVNSAILKSLGKQSSADLTKIYEDTSSLVHDLRTAGGPGAFFSMQDITSAIPKPQDG